MRGQPQGASAGSSGLGAAAAAAAACSPAWRRRRITALAAAAPWWCRLQDLISRFGGYLSFTITTPPSQVCSLTLQSSLAWLAAGKPGLAAGAAAQAPQLLLTCPAASPGPPRPLQEAAAAAVVRELSPSARLVYSLGGTQKYGARRCWWHRQQQQLCLPCQQGGDLAR